MFNCIVFGFLIYLASADDNIRIDMRTYENGGNFKVFGNDNKTFITFMKKWCRPNSKNAF